MGIITGMDNHPMSCNSSSQCSSQLYFFLAGALVPTIAYFFFQGRKAKLSLTGATATATTARLITDENSTRTVTENDYKSQELNDLVLNEEKVDTNQNKNNPYTKHEYDDDDDEDDDFHVAMALNSTEDPFSWSMNDAPFKMILCVNQELPMGKGKIAAQCCHAAVGCYKRASKYYPKAVRAWEMTGCAKIAVKCPTEQEMINEILVKAVEAGIPYYCVEDAGRTQIAAGSRTVLGLGPAPVRVFEDITSHLKLM